jgi:predicted PurR-regulated permease PerM
MLLTAAAVATLLAALIAWQVREALLMLLGAVALASTCEPAVRFLMARGLSRGLASTLAFAGGLALFVGAVTLVGGALLGEVDRALRLAPGLYERALARQAAQGGWLGDLAAGAPNVEELVDALAGYNPGNVLGGLLGLTSGLLSPLIFVLGAATLAVYWMFEQQRLEWAWLSLLPLQARTSARTIWSRCIAEIGIYIRGTVALVALTALLLAVVYSLLGLPFAVLLALIGGVAQVVPLLGGVLGLLIALPFALLQGPLSAGLTLGFGMAVLLGMRLVVEPRLYRGGVRVNPLLSVLLALALFEVGGLLWTLVAPPLAAALTVLYAGLLEATRQERTPQRRSELHELRERLEAARARAEEELEERPQLRGMLERAARLLDDTEAKLA